jgi:CheY-like chemotaxis protein
LRQALLNLVGNAVKFTQQGRIQLAVSVLPGQADAVTLRFAVKDTGIGIDAQHIPLLFRSFAQADDSTTRRYGGTGLGLAITSRLAQLMGGEVGVDSSPGLGSTFWFSACLKPARLAATSAQPVRATSAEEHLQQAYRGKRILLVEDNPVNREVALALLSDAGLVVDTADNGQIAVAMGRVQPYELVLMDMQMPVMNGLDATVALRALPGWSSVPIVAMTANAFEEERRACLAAGMNDFLAKPVAAPKLFTTVLHWLSAEVVPA